MSFGDLSVISKHHQALKLFLYSTDDYALICEDDVIFGDASLSAINDLAQGLSFDFIDIAGGDGLITKSVDLVVHDRFYLGANLIYQQGRHVITLSLEDMLKLLVQSFSHQFSLLIGRCLLLFLLYLVIH